VYIRFYFLIHDDEFTIFWTMTINAEDLRNLKILYENLTDIKLSDEEFLEKAQELLKLHLLLIDPNLDLCYEDYL